MWDSNTFQEYLRYIQACSTLTMEGLHCKYIVECCCDDVCSANGHPTVWETSIYPGMKQALIHVLQVTQDEIEHRKVCSLADQSIPCILLPMSKHSLHTIADDKAYYCQCQGIPCILSLNIPPFRIPLSYMEQTS